jgi:TonB family protein
MLKRLAMTSILIALCGFFVLQVRRTLLPEGARVPLDYLKNGGTPPRLRLKLDPEYSQEAIQARINASVQIAAVVSRDGGLRDIRVTRGAGFGLDEKAVEASREWRFTPAGYRGASVEVPVSLTLAFNIPAPDVPSANLHFDLPTGASRPVLTLGAVPASELPRGAIHLRFLVDRQGGVERLEGAEGSVLHRISGWRFTPAMLKGTPIQVAGSLDLYRTY